jgi:hypothetical protein
MKNTTKSTGMKVTTGLNAGGLWSNHNRAALKVRSAIKWPRSDIRSDIRSDTLYHSLLYKLSGSPRGARTFTDSAAGFSLAPTLLKGEARRTRVMNKSALGMLVGFSFLGGCASGGAGVQRGSVVMSGEAVKAFAAGPAVVHAYSLDGGGRVFVAQAKSGTDADCAGPAAGGAAAMAVEVDRRNVVTLASGQVACVETSGRRSYELMWHARPAAEPSAMVLAQARR